MVVVVIAGGVVGWAKEKRTQNVSKACYDYSWIFPLSVLEGMVVVTVAGVVVAVDVDVGDVGDSAKKRKKK